MEEQRAYTSVVVSQVKKHTSLVCLRASRFPLCARNYPSNTIPVVLNPRFTNDRENHLPPPLFLEIAAAERRKAIALKERLDDYYDMNYVNFDDLLWEEFFYYSAAEEAFDSRGWLADRRRSSATWLT